MRFYSCVLLSIGVIVPIITPNYSSGTQQFADSSSQTVIALAQTRSGCGRSSDCRGSGRREILAGGPHNLSAAGSVDNWLS